MANGKKVKLFSDTELMDMRGNERVFQLDSDFFLIYTGTSRQSLLPFLRVGSAIQVYPEWSQWIGHVVLSEEDPVNIGREIAWMRQGVASGAASVKYVGSKKRLDQLYNITGMSELEDKNIPVPMTAVAYGRISEEDSQRRHVYAVQKEDSFTIEIDSKPIFDFADRKNRNPWSVLTECTMLSEVLSKYPFRKGQEESNISFVWLAPETNVATSHKEPIVSPTLYWNCHGKGFLFEPKAGYHRDLFQASIDPMNVYGVSAVDGRTAGINETLLLAHRNQSEMLLDIPDEQQFALLKKFFHGANLRLMSSGVAIPFARQVFLSKSRRRNYSAMSWRYHANSDHFVNVFFPSRKFKGKKNIENIRPPFDVELQRIDNHEDIQEVGSNLCLQFAGEMDVDTFRLQRLKDRAYPLIPNTEYIFHQAEKYEALSESYMQCFANTSYSNALTKILHFHSLEEQEAGATYIVESLEELLYIHQAAKQQGIIARLNLDSFVRLLAYSPAYQTYNKEQKKLYQLVKKTCSLRDVNYDAVIALSQKEIQIHICSFGGGKLPKDSLLFVESFAREALPWFFPNMNVRFADNQARIANVKGDRLYMKQLSKWTKLVDRKPEWRIYEPILGFLEKMMERKIFFLEQWTAAHSLISGLGSQSEDESLFGNRSYLSSTNGKGPRVSLWLSRLGLESGYVAFTQSLDRVRDQIWSGRILLLFVLVSFLAILLFYTMGWDSTNGGGESQALELTEIGDLQGGEGVSGAEDIEATPAEVLAYANILADKNNFSKLSSRDIGAQVETGNGKRNPNLIFPKDRLKLPDDRLILVKPGSYIWEIAEREYRQDFARLLLLEEKIRKQEDSDLQMAEYARWMRRLAVTPQMQQVEKRLKPILGSSSIAD